MNPSLAYYLYPFDSGQKLINILFSSTGFADWKRVDDSSCWEEHNVFCWWDSTTAYKQCGRWESVG